MPEIKIISDVDNRIEYDKVEHCELNRAEVISHRERLDFLKNQKADIEREIAELELIVANEEEIVRLADEKKDAEVVAEVPAEEVNI